MPILEREDQTYEVLGRTLKYTGASPLDDSHHWGWQRTFRGKKISIRISERYTYYSVSLVIGFVEVVKYSGYSLKREIQSFEATVPAVFKAFGEFLDYDVEG